MPNEKCNELFSFYPLEVQLSTSTYLSFTTRNAVHFVKIVGTKFIAPRAILWQIALAKS